jgi:branched-chain amino acid transport system ATP-binding protein
VAVALLEVTGLVRRFRGLAAVDDLSFSVDEGKTLAIIGPNGAGKSTTFNLISGLLPTHGGAIRLRGVDVTRAPAHARGARSHFPGRATFRRSGCARQRDGRCAVRL